MVRDTLLTCLRPFSSSSPVINLSRRCRPNLTCADIKLVITKRYKKITNGSSLFPFFLSLLQHCISCLIMQLLNILACPLKEYSKIGVFEVSEHK